MSKIVDDGTTGKVNFGVSLVIPIHNEADVLEENVSKFDDYMLSLNVPYEILLCDNGSSDDSFEISKKISLIRRGVKVLHEDKRGLGIGIKLGILNSRFENIMFYAIDLPFGLEIIKESLDKFNVNGCDLVIGSKANVYSNINVPIKRKIFSKSYNFLLRLFFGLKIGDTQGSMMFKSLNVLKFIDYLDASNAFIQAQICIYHNLYGFNICEIPVNYSSYRKGSKMRLFSDGYKMFSEILTERKKYKQLRNLIKNGNKT